MKKSKELFRHQQQQQQQAKSHPLNNQPIVQQQYQLQNYNSSNDTAPQHVSNSSNVKNPTFNYNYGE